MIASNGILQGLCNMFLTYNRIKIGWPVLSCRYHKIFHAANVIILGATETKIRGIFY